ncbi:hypothetical protein GE09DRAFT_1195786 [Coniochaeta sp. 2T2.1]|nr:hypothetical protein GE09DRAFT_1195786 [Coniochaeta sp. 2T2.1]
MSLTKLLFRKSDKGKAPEKKTPDKPLAQSGGPKKWDQNLMGEGQFFGTGNRTLVNGSIRSVDMSRPQTPSSSRISPYNHNTHALAASSMYDLSNISHSRHGSGNNLKPAASDTNLRTKYNAQSVSNLKVPGPGLGSRPGTPSSGRTKAWVNPLDVHFGRTTPSALPSTPKSPLAHYEFGAEQQQQADNGSVFGDKAENIADTIMRSVSQKEQEKAEKERQEKGKVEKEREEREARQKAQEEEKKRDEEREKEREKNKAAAAAAALRAPQQPPQGHPALSNSRAMNGPGGPVFQGRHDQRPGSRNGNRNPSPMGPFHGPGEHRPGSRNGSGSHPSPPIGHGPSRGPFQGQMDHRPSSRNGQQHGPGPRFQGHTDQRPSSRNGPHERPLDRPHFQGQIDQRPGSRNGPQERPVFQGQMDHHRPGSRNGPRRDHTPPYGHPPGGHPNGHPQGHPNGRPMNGPPRPRDGHSPMRGPGPVNGHPRSPGLGPGPMMNGHIHTHKGSPMIGPPCSSPNGPPRGPAMNGSPRNGSPRNASPMAPPRPSPNPNNLQQGQNGYFPGDPPSPTASTPTTTTSTSSPRTSGEKPSEPVVIRDLPARRETVTSTSPKRASVSMALDALEKSLVDAQVVTEDASTTRDSSASSAYSVDQEVESPVQPRPSPPYQQRSTSGSSRPIPGRNVARPNPAEYGVVLPKVRTAPNAAAVANPPSPPLPSPPAQQRMEHASLQPAPLFKQSKWTPPEDASNRYSEFSTPRPAPSPTPNHAPSTLGTTPPTPDPTNPNWPLAPPPPPAAASSPPQLQRSNLPPPLNFNFSPDASSRDHANHHPGGGLYTPQPARTLSQSRSNDTIRPSTAGGGLGVGGSLAGGDDIGMARGPRVRHAGHGTTGIADRFGTPLI